MHCHYVPHRPILSVTAAVRSQVQVYVSPERVPEPRPLYREGEGQVFVSPSQARVPVQRSAGRLRSRRVRRDLYTTEGQTEKGTDSNYGHCWGFRGRLICLQ